MIPTLLRLFLILLAIAPVLKAAPIHEVVSSFSVSPQNPGLGSLISGPDGYHWGTTKAGGAYSKGTVYKVKADGSDWETVISFTGNAGVNKGATPSAELFYDGAGFMWGTTQQGGANGFGTIFKLNVSTRELTTLVEFTNRLSGNKGATASGKLVNDGAGNLWGTTNFGGTNGYGTVFKINTTTGVMTTVVEFTSDAPIDTGAYPLAGLTRHPSGLLWGTTSEGGVSGRGTIFKIDPQTEVLTTVLEFSPDTPGTTGAGPSGELVLDPSGLYWGVTTYGGTGGYGTIFKFNPVTGGISTVVEFTNNGATNKGAYPQAGLTSDGAGFYWGTTSEGGSSLFGTLFKVNMSTGVLTTVTKLPASGSTLNEHYPRAGLMNDGAGFMWGTTELGGPVSGTVYRAKISTGEVSVVVDFAINATTSKGRIPYAGLSKDSVGRIWGSTSAGGARNLGTVFRIDPVTDTLTTVIDFNGSGPANKGTQPNGTLVDDGSGSLWGTTHSGGVNTYGTIYKINAATGVLTTMHEFANSGVSGSSPRSGLVADGAGFFWGTTNFGGDDSGGTVYKINANTGVFSQVAKFSINRSAPNGTNPYSGLIKDAAGFFWGTTTQGGSTAYGTVYKVNASTGALSKAVQFSSNGASNKGSYPYATLVSDGAGFFWGTTQKGGANDHGTVFKVNASTNVLTTIAEFTSNGTTNRGSQPLAGLLNDGAGSMWGTTNLGGLNGLGTVFRINIATGQLTTVADFTGIGPQALSGSSPGYAPLLRHSDGHIYGVTMGGGPRGAGTVYRLRLGPIPETLAASSITASTAKLNGAVNPNGFTTTVAFEWGTDPTLSSNTVQNAGSTSTGSSAEPVSASLGNLTASTTYYYRIRALNSDNSVVQKGQIRSFTTAANDPDADKDGLPDEWEVAHFDTPTTQGATDDYDRDGIVELLEWAFDLNPKNPNSRALPDAKVQNGYLTITLTKKPGASYLVQTTGSLSSPDWSAASTTVLSDTAATLTVRDNVPTNSNVPRFIRIRVSVP